MTRIVSYNILAGGYSVREKGARRVRQLENIIRSARPDIVGVVEATNPRLTQKPLVIEELAEHLGMQLVMGGDPTNPNDYQLALLTRLPVLSTRIHKRPGILNKPLLEVCVEEEDGQQLTIFVTHLYAAFNKGRGGNGLRVREVKEILRITASFREQGIPHVMMGDFNSMAPGDPFKASQLLRYVVQLDEAKGDLKEIDGNPQLDLVVPPQLRIFNPLLRIIPRSILLSGLFDAAASFYAPRTAIRLIQEAGYIDSYRRVHPRAWGFSCPAGAPAGRIDFIFSSPAMAERLETCYVLTEGDELPGSYASDHLAIGAEYGLNVSYRERTSKLDSAVVG